MTIPLQTIVFCLPAVIAFIVGRRQGLSWSEAARDLGWRGTSLQYLGLGLLLGLIPGVILLPGVELIPSEIMDDPNIANARYAGWTATPASFLQAWLYEAVYVALGEEVFFRGLIGGVLFRRLGFAVGNVLQALIFLLPHLLLLSVSTRLWPLLLSQFLGGWLNGWLLFKSEGILPGWIAHSLGNAFGALLFMA
jgi:membrane protease YdiL (CAAX protease family)